MLITSDFWKWIVPWRLPPTSELQLHATYSHLVRWVVGGIKISKELWVLQGTFWPLNYYPISILPIFSNVLDAPINIKLVKHLTSYGICFSRSTVCVLMAIMEFFYQSLDKNGKAQAVALVISKAFDRIWHIGLLHKLKGDSVSGWIFGLIQLFLTNHVLKVVLVGHASRSFYINAGVL